MRTPLLIESKYIPRIMKKVSFYQKLQFSWWTPLVTKLEGWFDRFR